ncbi:MAG TPA: ABC transporter permease, partial [Acholeplasmataceae bacterium]|nr:ABC transporter permease [Acholeplasmataceae bacterium]
MSLEFIISQSLYFIIPLLVVAIAGLFAERSGTINIA